mgnify:CR=1 FL=1
MLFGEASSQMNSILIGSFIMILTGIVDDIKPIIEGTNSYSSSYQTLIDIETIKQHLILFIKYLGG